MSTNKLAYTNDDIEAVECRCVTFIPPVPGSDDDYHLVKEIIHLKDKRKVPNIRILKNYERKYWITKEGFRREHTQKKEWEDVKKLTEHKSTQSQLIRSAAGNLKEFGFTGTLKKLSRSPYLYGCDILSTAVIKQEVYRNRWPDINTPSSIATSDTETDMVHGTERVIMQSISYQNKVYTAVTKGFLANIPGSPTEKIRLCKEALVKYLGAIPGKDKNNKDILIDVLKERNIEWELEIVDNDGVVVYNCLQKAHEWQPDLLTFWNMDFDIKKMNKSLVFHGYNVADAWSDKAVASKYRFFKYVPGSDKKITASGKVTPIAMHARWNTVYAPASFYVVDSMCAYKQIRTGKPEERSYSLDAIMQKYLKLGKLKFTAADGLARADWHIFMQKNHPIEYIVYNVFDCVGFDMLCEKTKDLSVSFPSGAAMTDFSKFNSQPRRVVDKLHYFVMDRGLIVGTTSDEMKTDFDEETISLKNWITMLPAHLVADNGIKFVEEYPNIATNVRLHVAD